MAITSVTVGDHLSEDGCDDLKYGAMMQLFFSMNSIGSRWK